MKRRFAGFTDTGQVRAVNQDNYYVDPEGRFFIVADGMGGHAGGQEASKIATDTVREYFATHWETEMESEGLIKSAIVQANEAILADQSEHPERAEMGTTLVVVIYRQDQFWYGHVGDSRLYRLDGGTLKQITTDHTWVARAMNLGHLNEEQARTHPLRHVLLQCLGRHDLHQIDIEPVPVAAGDRLLLCSDGLSGEVTDDEIRNYLLSTPSCQEAASTLVNAANQAGGADNITVVVVEADS
jgi:serine/threonine protein phosphatase PrpC